MPAVPASQGLEGHLQDPPRIPAIDGSVGSTNGPQRKSFRKTWLESEVWLIPEQQGPHLCSASSLAQEVADSHAATEDKNIARDSGMDGWIPGIQLA